MSCLHFLLSNKWSTKFMTGWRTWLNLWLQKSQMFPSGADGEGIQALHSSETGYICRRLILLNVCWITNNSCQENEKQHFCNLMAAAADDFLKKNFIFN